MDKLLVLLALFCSQVCSAQYIPSDKLATDRVDEQTHQSIKRTYWHVLRRATLSNPLNIFFRVSAIGNDHSLELKITKRDVGFVVGRNEPLECYMSDGRVVTLYNSTYQHTTNGAGSRNGKHDGPGVWLTYPMTATDLAELQRCNVVRLRIHSEGSFMGCGILDDNSDLFRDEMRLITE
jgi:hypothetical protein